MELGYIIEFYSVVKENGMMTFAGEWTKLETVVKGDIARQKEKYPCCPLMYKPSLLKVWNKNGVELAT